MRQTLVPALRVLAILALALMTTPTAAMLLPYSVQMIVGTLVATVGVRFLRERAGAATQVRAHQHRHPA
ncbi:hypothetical protein [Streptomyces sp. NPDC048436]|uniref:hypothetical protein n=1 Tax=Streptomyces sp. NPDC048436 TaxID=3365550 RepID=UPI003715B7B1